ncbi:MAG: hypothetical protein HY822_03520, partial [Acidobacteria bacterium]|nr:hypothetical protein [Acidobacteriota bacterium]
MSARYIDPQVTLDAERRALRVGFRLGNDSGETWRREDGLALGWQIYDPAS